MVAILYLSSFAVQNRIVNESNTGQDETFLLKRMMDYWKSTISDLDARKKYLTTKDLVEMAMEAKNITLPPQFTTLGAKIAANFSGLKGDEYRSWTLAYSAVLLKGRLVGDHIRNWMLFVRANRILSAPSLSLDDLTVAHNLLKQFVANNVRLYGRDFITPNMHLHLHLEQTIRDFGPIYSTWLYSFERLNGDIKEITTNFKDNLEFTYMERFLQHIHFQDYIRLLPRQIKTNTTMMSMFALLLPTISQHTQNSQSLDFNLTTFLSSYNSEDTTLTGTEPLPPSCFPLTITKQTVMSTSHYKCLVDFYKTIYSDFTIINITSTSSPPSFFSSQHVFVNTCINKFNEIDILGQQFHSFESRSSRGAFIQAHTASGTNQVGRILYFFTHDLEFPSPNLLNIRKEKKEHTFAFVQWYEANDMAFRSFDDHYVEVWKQTFKPIDATSILPVQQIGTCVAVMKYIDNNILAIPLLRRIIGC